MVLLEMDTLSGVRPEEVHACLFFTRNTPRHLLS
jgi:hypothetical protein